MLYKITTNKHSQLTLRTGSSQDSPAPAIPHRESWIKQPPVLFPEPLSPSTDMTQEFGFLCAAFRQSLVVLGDHLWQGRWQEKRFFKREEPT